MLCDCRRVFSVTNVLRIALLAVLLIGISVLLDNRGYTVYLPTSSLSGSKSEHASSSANEPFTPPPDPYVGEGVGLDSASSDTESWADTHDGGDGPGDADGYPVISTSPTQGLEDGKDPMNVDVEEGAQGSYDVDTLESGDVNDEQPISQAFTDACPSYIRYSEQRHEPFSTGRHSLSYQRPDPACRTFRSKEVDNLILKYKSIIKDPDLYRLFENCFPNTLDTAVRWKGQSEAGDDLAFIITGDIDAMWLRDSANQLQSYRSLLRASESVNSLASLYRGVINMHARYLQASPYCNSFQPPPESGITPAGNAASNHDKTVPPVDPQVVFECKYELDSLASFLQISTDYYDVTEDIEFFRSSAWDEAVQGILGIAEGMMAGTYAEDGTFEPSKYRFLRLTNTAADALTNGGNGSPAAGDTGLIRSDFRPSDDAVIYQYFIPANMMFSRYLQSTASIMDRLPGRSAVANKMRQFSSNLKEAITTHGIIEDPKYGKIYAYEIDGFGSINSMDDANIPSLLSAPFFGYLDASDPVYQSTRRKVLSADNPYFMRGSAINAVGGPHDGPGKGWPMASIVRIMTSDNDTEVYDTLKELVSTTAGLGLMHESIHASNEHIFTRQWFSWANGLFGQMIIDLHQRMPNILEMSFQ